MITCLAPIPIKEMSKIVRWQSIAYDNVLRVYDDGTSGKLQHVMVFV